VTTNPSESARSAESTDLDGLAARAAAGDGSAAERLFDDLRERFDALAKRRVREDEREDCVQDALRIVHRKYRARPGGVAILPWSLTVLRHVIGNVYQRRTRAEQHEELQDEGPTVDFDPLAGVEADRLRTRVAIAVARLARDHPRCGVIFRAILDGLARGDGPDEVVRAALEAVHATEPELTPGNFHVILHRCRGRLHRALEGARA
jgi:DNA-directed RNA polymerase specialized sigma24 family protein